MRSGMMPVFRVEVELVRSFKRDPHRETPGWIDGPRALVDLMNGGYAREAKRRIIEAHIYGVEPDEEAVY
jgi:hypothetical protein